MSESPKSIKLKSGQKYVIVTALFFIVSIISAVCLGYTTFGVAQFFLMLFVFIGVFGGIITAVIGIIETGAAKRFGDWMNSDD